MNKHLSPRELHFQLLEKYPPSESCSCDICKKYCQRPGWWTLEEASIALESGLANRMMLEISPERNFGVLSPAFKGNEGNYALEVYASQGCTFLHEGLCELYGTGLEPLECRYCHHDRKGKGAKCHTDIEEQWHTPDAKRLVVQWGNLTGFWNRQGVMVQEKP
jgi:hypothetical protein